MRVFAGAMGENPYVCADRFTMADISVGYAILLARMIGIGSDVPETLQRYFDRLATRPAFGRAKQAQASAAPAAPSAG